MDYLLGDPVGQLWLMLGVALLFVGAVQGMLFVGSKGTLTGRIVFTGRRKSLELKIRSNYQPILLLRYKNSGDRLLAVAGEKLRMVDGESPEGIQK